MCRPAVPPILSNGQTLENISIYSHDGHVRMRRQIMFYANRTFFSAPLELRDICGTAAFVAVHIFIRCPAAHAVDAFLYILVYASVFYVDVHIFKDCCVVRTFGQ